MSDPIPRPCERLNENAIMKIPASLLIIPALLAPLAGCVTANPDVVSYGQTQRMSTVQDATVIAVRSVLIDGQQSGTGAVAGGMVGSIAGSSIGGYRDGFIGSILGAVAGAVVGNAVERGTTAQNGVELTLQLKNGDKRMVIQGNGNESFQPGDAVMVISDGYRARVTHAAPGATAAPAAPAYMPPAESRPAPVYSPR
jgi:outer membrane lipoprotein SlyB